METSATKSHARADGAAVFASLLCLLHCLALPLIAASLPALGLLVRNSETVHWALLLFAVPLGLWALWRGRPAAGPGPLLVGVTGFVLMAAAVVFFAETSAERWLTVAGVLAVAGAHGANWLSARRRGQRGRISNAMPAAAATKHWQRSG